MADSFGEHSYINRSEDRYCSGDCPCQRLNEQTSCDFAFIVRKTASTIDVELSSNILQSRVSKLLGQAGHDPPRNVVDGFKLLENSGFLETYLRQMRTEIQGQNPMGVVVSPSFDQKPIFEAELALFAEGLIGDHQIFESFGYENLYEKGYLTRECCMAWTNSRISEAEDHLNRIIHATGQSEGINGFDTAANNDSAEQPLAHPSMLSERPEDQNFLSLSLAASSGLVAETERLLERGINPNEPPPPSTNVFTTIIVGAIRNGHQQVVTSLIAYGANIDGASPEGVLDEISSPLIAAIFKGRSEIITQLLDHGANPRILSHIKRQDQWLVAHSLIDHGVDATLLLLSLEGQKLADPRLLYVLLEGGADICSTWPASTQNHGLSFRFSDYDVAYVHNMRVRTRQMIGAIGRNDLTRVEAEISRDADPTFGVDAALSKRDLKILRLLLRQGADLRYLEFGKKQASLQEAITADACLIMVAEEGFTSAVGSILRLRESSNVIEGRNGKIFLTNLIRLNRTPILKMLLNKGIFSRDFVAASSEWSLPIAAKSSMDSFRLLLNFGSCVSTAPFAVVAAENLTDLGSLLVIMRKCMLGNHVNVIRDGMTPLMLAVDKGAGKIAQLLRVCGANPEILTERGDIFTMAEGDGAIALAKESLRSWDRCSVSYVRWTDRGDSYKDLSSERYLSQDGSLTALQSHWNLPSLEPHYQPIPPEYKVFDRDWPMREAFYPAELEAFDSIEMMEAIFPAELDDKVVNEIRLRNVHQEFQKEHAHILTCAQSSTARKTLEPLGCANSRAWGQYGFIRNYSFAWRRGMATMRALRRGEATANLNDAIWFLTIAKAILFTDTNSPSDWQERFVSDLGRYQGLFSHLDGSLDAFRFAVQDIWGTSLTYPPNHGNIDLTTLKYFQELAGTLLHGSESPLRHRENSHYGLLTSQRRWRMHQPSLLSQRDGELDPLHKEIPENLVERGDPAGSHSSSSTDFREGRAWQEYGSHSPFRDTIRSQPYSSIHCIVALTIIAGFIFSVVLSFLLGKISISFMAYFLCWALLMNSHSSAKKLGPTNA